MIYGGARDSPSGSTYAGRSQISKATGSHAFLLISVITIYATTTSWTRRRHWHVNMASTVFAFTTTGLPASGVWTCQLSGCWRRGALTSLIACAGRMKIGAAAGTAGIARY